MRIVDSYDESNVDADPDNLVAIDDAAGPWGRGQSFTSTGGTLYRASFYLKRVDNESPQGNMWAQIYAHSGTFGTSSIGTGECLALSEPISATVLTTDFALINFDFTGSNQINLEDGTNYVILLHYGSPGRGPFAASWNGSDGGVYMGYDATSATHEGNMIRRFVQENGNVSYFASATVDLIFYVYVDFPFQQQSPGAQLDASALIDSYPESNQDGENYSAWTGNYVYYGQAFDSGAGGLLSSAKFYLKKIGALTGNINAKLYAHTGIFGTSSLGTGTPLATSNNLVANSAITTTFQLVEFFFTGGNQYNMAANTKYCIVFNWEGGDVNNRILVGTDNSSPTHSGQLVRRLTTDSWDNEAVDCIFYVYKTAAGVPGGSAQDNLNRIAGTTGLSNQGAANAAAGTTGLSIQGALGTKYSKSGSTQEIINQQINDGNTYIIHDGLARL